jgi:hypothetical protein
LAGKFPFYTPYQYSGNNPVTFYDLDGEETVDNLQTGSESNGQQSSTPQVYPSFETTYSSDSSSYESIDSNESSRAKNKHKILSNITRGASYLYFFRGVASMFAGDKEGYEKYMTAGKMLHNFSTGTGDATIYLTGKDDAVARELNRNNRLVNEALSDFNKKLTVDNLTVEDFFSNELRFKGKYEFSPDQTTLIESLKKHYEGFKHPVDFMVGGMTYSIIPIRDLQSEGKDIIGLSITFENPMSIKSLTYRAFERIEDRDGGNGSPLSTVYNLINYKHYFINDKK